MDSSQPPTDCSATMQRLEPKNQPKRAGSYGSVSVYHCRGAHPGGRADLCSGGVAQRNSLAVPKGIHPGSVTGDARIPLFGRLITTHHNQGGPIAVGHIMEDLLVAQTTAPSTVEDLMEGEGLIEIGVWRGERSA